MQRFLLGFLLGAAVVGLLAWLSARPSPEGALGLPASGAVPEVGSPAPPEASAPTLRLEPAASAEPTSGTHGPSVRARGRRDQAQHGGLAIQIGDGVDLAGWRVVPRGDPQADLECLDMHDWGVLLSARHGGRPLLRSGPTPVFAELDVEEARRRVRHAPATLPPGDVWISSQQIVSERATALGQFAAADGSAFLVRVVALDWTSSALDRRAWLQAERVERRDEGSALIVDEHLVPVPGPGSERAAQLCAWGAALPGFNASTARGFPGEWSRLEGERGRGKIQGFHKRIELPAPWSSVLETGPWLSLHIPEGTTDDARLALDHHSTVLLGGDARGEARVTDHATLIVAGDLLGRVEVENHGILIVEGRVRGTVKVGSWARVLLLQGAGGTLDLTSSRSSQLLLGGHLRGEDIAGLGAPGTGCVLHAERSDLADGVHPALAGWEAVHVADERWVAFRR